MGCSLQMGMLYSAVCGIRPQHKSYFTLSHDSWFVRERKKHLTGSYQRGIDPTAVVDALSHVRTPLDLHPDFPPQIAYYQSGIVSPLND